MKKRDVFIILIFLLIAAFFIWLFWNDLTQTINARDQEPVGTLVIKKNVVQRRFGDRALWDRLRTESPVYINNLIRVPEASSAILYIKDTSIALDENTLIRISLSPDGEIQIDLTGGSLSVIADENSQGILLNLNGEVYKVNPGTVLSASVDDDNSGLQYFLNADEVLSREQFAITENITQTNPAQNSAYRFYKDEDIIVNFSWTETEGALSYVLEISDTEDFSGNVLRRESKNLAYSASLNEGEWHWRVTPVFPAIYGEASVGGEPAVSSFSVQKSEISLAEMEQLSITEWIDQVIGNREQVTGDSEESIAQQPEPLPIPQPTPQPRPQPRPQPVITQTPAPPPPLTAPVITTPMNNRRFGSNELQDRREIVFSWSPVPEAQNYVFILYQQTTTGRRQIIRTAPDNQTSYTLSNFRDLENGTYIWQVEAIGNINGAERRVTTAEQSFVLNVPLPTPIQPNEVQQVDQGAVSSEQ